LVRRIIDTYSTPGALVGDAFLGSGTTGIEALRAGRSFWGADINPVAVLISKAKCVPVPPDQLAHEWSRLNERLQDLPRVGRRALTAEECETILAIDIHRASPKQRFEYWFPNAHRDALAQLLVQVRSVDGDAPSTLFLCAFSNILRRCSIWLSGSTKPQKDLGKLLNDPVEAFRGQVRDALKRNVAYWDDLEKAGLPAAQMLVRCELHVGDARRLPLDDGQVDLLVTSPPYATCYDYIDLHQLTQLWFEKYNVLTPSDPRRECIGSLDLAVRGERRTSGEHNTSSAAADAALNALTELAEQSGGDVRKDILREVRALGYYYRDMAAVMREFARVVAPDGRLVLVIGDSYKRGMMLPTSRAFEEMAEAVGFTLERRIVRKVAGRVLTHTRDKSTGRFSSSAQSDIKAYPEEDVLVLRR
jgi:DNA modification methylase